MQCECHARIKNLVDNRLAEAMPEGSKDLSWNFPQMRFAVTDSGIDMIPIFEIKGQYQAPKKLMGFKRVKIDTFIAATYCPFCGIKCKPDQQTEHKPE